MRCKSECATCDESGECANTSTHQCRNYLQEAEAKCLARDACPLGTNFVRFANGTNSAPSDADAAARNESLSPSPSPSLDCPLAFTASSASMSREQLLQQVEHENLELLKCAEAQQQKHVERVCVRCDAQCHPQHGCTGAGNHSCRLCAHKTYYPDEKDESKVCTLRSIAYLLVLYCILAPVQPEHYLY